MVERCESQARRIGHLERALAFRVDANEELEIEVGNISRRVYELSKRVGNREDRRHHPYLQAVAKRHEDRRIFWSSSSEGSRAYPGVGSADHPIVIEDDSESEELSDYVTADE